MLGIGDQIYEAVNAPGWYYFFPKELCRSSEPAIQLQGERLFADFSVSLCDVQIEKVKAELVQKGIRDPKARVFRGNDIMVSAMSLRDAYGSFDPKIQVQVQFQFILAEVQCLRIDQIKRKKQFSFMSHRIYKFKWIKALIVGKSRRRELFA